jgi:uncharacterized tellurite resistance protein B-like protein
MLAKLKTLLFEGKAPSGAVEAHSHEELHLAAGALMVEAARLDGTFDADERAHIHDTLRDRFDLDEETTGALIDAAVEAADTIPEIFGFTRTIRDHFSHDERIEMMEMLWEVAYADGELHDYEANLMRQVTGLLYVTDRESGDARKRAQAKARASGVGAA